MPQFVILEHCWNGVHFDLMLEVEPEAPLRTWALDAMPEPGRLRTARGLPDHRRVYLEYEGPVSGDRGTVRRIDRGTYRVVAWSDDRILLELEGSVLAGPAVLERIAAAAPGSAQSGRPLEPDWRFGLGKFDSSA